MKCWLMFSPSGRLAVEWREATRPDECRPSGYHRRLSESVDTWIAGHLIPANDVSLHIAADHQSPMSHDDIDPITLEVACEGENGKS